MLRSCIHFCILTFTLCVAFACRQQEVAQDLASSGGVPVSNEELIAKSVVFVSSWYPNSNDNVNCTGVAISPTKILTAAHCVHNKAPGIPVTDDSKIDALYAEYSKKNDLGFWVTFGTRRQDVAMQRKVEMTAIKVHPDYPKVATLPDRSQNDKSLLSEYDFFKEPFPDLAVLTLAQPAPKGFAPAISIASSPLKNQGIVFAGWGDLSDGDTSPRILNKWALPNLTKDELLIDAISKNFIISTYGKSTTFQGCFGDSGGPLFDSSQTTVFGIQSRALKCGTGVSYFVDVSSYREWILKN